MADSIKGGYIMPASVRFVNEVPLGADCLYDALALLSYRYEKRARLITGAGGAPFIVVHMFTDRYETDIQTMYVRVSDGLVDRLSVNGFIVDQGCVEGARVDEQQPDSRFYWHKKWKLTVPGEGELTRHMLSFQGMHSESFRLRRMKLGIFNPRPIP